MGWIVGLALELVVGSAILAVFVAVVVLTLGAFDPDFARRLHGLRERGGPRLLSDSPDSLR